jgi:hypothetical protein
MRPLIHGTRKSTLAWRSSMGTVPSSEHLRKPLRCRVLKRTPETGAVHGFCGTEGDPVRIATQNATENATRTTTQNARGI